MLAQTQSMTCVHRLFEAEAARRPHAPAIVSGERTLTYGALNERANQLARHLGAKGVKTRDRVGLFLERSPDAVVAILALLKSGAAYVPLDPSHPVERVRRIVAEADIRAVVAEGPLRAAAQALECVIVEADDPAAPWENESGVNLIDGETAIDPSDLSYVLYTSGSTGRPKGVMAEHRNVVSFVRAFNEVIRLTEDDRVFQGFSLGFDGSVEEMWMAFSNGAALVVPPRGTARFGNDLAQLITSAGATVFSTVPTSLSLISDALPTVRLMIVSGERCTPELVNRWGARGRRLLNVYGPTETTVNATVAECSSNRDITIGRPLPCYEVHLLDDEGKPVADGEAGEIWIGGPGVARGYLNQPELTEKHFVTFGPGVPGEPPRRMYRTGDLGRLDASGELAFLGRRDHQVKVRGYRIELCEVEAVLAEHRSVQAAVVTLAERDGTTELAAYVTASDPAGGVDRADVHALLSSRLPSYMVPAFLDVVDVMPTLASGKLDRRALPPPATLLVPARRALRRPRTEREAELVRAFGELFKNDAISIDDDFFRTLGGYSLLAARLVSQLRRDFGLDVAIRDVYENPNVESLAALLTQRMANAARARDTTRDTTRVQRVSSGDVYGRLSPAARAFGMGLQIAGVYVLYGIMALPLLGWFLSYDAWKSGGLSWSAFALRWVVVSAATWPALLTLSIAVKWLVIGRYKPGAYPLWGGYYVRFWFVRHVQLLALPGLLAGTPLLPLYLRCMGARVGRNCVLDTVHAAIFDLLHIGEETSVGSDTQLLGYHVEDGFLRIGSVRLGDRCFVGIHSALALNVTMGDDARLGDLSLLPDGASIPPGEARSGSPARPAAVPAPEGPLAPSSAARRAVFGGLHLVTIYALGLAALPALLPSLFLVWRAAEFGSCLRWIASIPVAGVLALVALCLWIPLAKRVLLHRVEPGVYRTESLLYLRKWAVDLLMHVSRTVCRPLYTTIYLPPWLRLLGAKIGRRAELSTVSQISPELTEIGSQSFLADGSMMGGRRTHRGWLELAPSKIGFRSFVGNGAIVPAGASLGDECLLGCLSAPPAGLSPTPNGTEWLGSPSFALPHRQKVGGFDASVTHEPTRKLIAQRLVIDALRIVLPSAIGASELQLFETLLARTHTKMPLLAWLGAMPLAALVSAAAALLSVVAAKKILIGTFHPTIKPLWSTFVWLNEALNGAYETVAAPLLVPLLGTPYCAPWLRLLGCKIGRHVYLETTLFSEFDLVNIGDYAALNAGAVIQNHLFEDRIMKASHLRIGENCSVGGMAVVLYDTEMLPGSSVGPLSLLMKGETLPSRTRWVGIPTAQLALDVASEMVAPRAVSQTALVERWS